MATEYLSTKQVLLLENLMYMGAENSVLPNITVTYLQQNTIYNQNLMLWFGNVVRDIFLDWENNTLR